MSGWCLDVFVYIIDYNPSDTESQPFRSEGSIPILRDTVENYAILGQHLGFSEEIEFSFFSRLSLLFCMDIS